MSAWWHGGHSPWPALPLPLPLPFPPLSLPGLTEADVVEHLLAVWCHLAYSLKAEDDLTRLLAVRGTLTHLEGEEGG